MIVSKDTTEMIRTILAVIGFTRWFYVYIVSPVSDRVTGAHRVRRGMLYEAVRDRRWNVVRALLRRRDARRMIRHRGFDGSDPLYLTCLFGGPADVVRAVCAAEPCAPSRRTDHGDTALHVSLRHASFDVVVALLEADPDTAIAEDGNGCAPLHFAVLFRRSPAVIRRLLEVGPEATEAEDRRGVTSLALLLRLAEEEPRYERDELSTYDDDNDGRDDLDDDFNRRAFVGVLATLLRVRRFGRVDDRDDEKARSIMRTPLHEVLRATTTAERKAARRPFLRALDSCAHEACSRPDARGNFALHALCAEWRL